MNCNQFSMIRVDCFYRLVQRQLSGDDSSRFVSKRGPNLSMSKSSIQMSTTQVKTTFTKPKADGECGTKDGVTDDHVTGLETNVYKAGDCIASPADPANTWVKVPLYDCGSGAELKGVTYKNDDCSTETDTPATETLAPAGECVDNGGTGQAVSCQVGDFVPKDEYYQMTTHTFTDSPNCEQDATVSTSEKIYQAGKCIEIKDAQDQSLDPPRYYAVPHYQCGGILYYILHGVGCSEYLEFSSSQQWYTFFTTLFLGNEPLYSAKFSDTDCKTVVEPDQTHPLEPPAPCDNGVMVTCRKCKDSATCANVPKDE